MATLNLLAFDLGASNGRGILGRFDGKTLTMEDIHRFENNFIDLNGVFYWDVLNLYRNMKEAFHKSKDYAKVDAFGIDTWGVDFGLLDKQGQLLGNPRSYRYSVMEDAERTHKKISYEKLFARTGISSLQFNTVYQLDRRRAENDPALAAADTLLLMPDLLGYFFTGVKKSEYTNVTTTMLYDPEARDWAWDVIDELGFPRHLFTEIDRAGTVRGKLLPAIVEETGVDAVLAAVGTHDTASAVAAIPGKGKFAFCSSGTWSLFGVETDKPIISDKMRESIFSNEGTVQGGFRPLKNIMGMWLIQECRRYWRRNGHPDINWDDIDDMAAAAEPFASIIDPDYSEFFNGGNMPVKIQEYCRRTGQPVPETVGQVARCIYESLALKYRWAFERLEEIRGEKLDSLNIVGGGIKNRPLNQMAANAIGKPVITGPIEGACIGNFLMQAMALGEIADIEEARDVVRSSITVETYEPAPSAQWEDAYGRLLDLIGK